MPTIITVSGRTFPIRETLKRLGGQWDSGHQRWEFRRLSATERAKLASTPGIFVAEVEHTDPFATDDGDYFSAPIGETVRVRSSAKPGAVYGDDPTFHNHFADQNPKAFFGYSSLGAFTDYVASLRPNEAFHHGAGFTGTRDMREAVSIARDGWPEGVAMAEELSARLALERPQTPQRRYALAGGSVSVGRMLAGDPVHMIRRPKQPGRKAVTFFVEAGCSAIIKPETMKIRAAAVAAMVDIMESVGYTCAVVAVDTSVSLSVEYQLTVQLKEQGERLNLSDIMFGLGHPSFLRRFSFATCSSVPETKRIHVSQGSPSNAFDDEHRCGPGEFYVPVLDHQAQTRELKRDPLTILPFITPTNLPIELTPP